MTKKTRFAMVTVRMVEQVGTGGLSYQEFCVLTYMLIFCGTTEGLTNPYKRGRAGIIEVFRISDSRVKSILTSLQKKGFIHPIYRVQKSDGTFVGTKSLKYARSIKLGDGGRYLRTYYKVTRLPQLNNKKLVPKTVV